MRPARLLCAGAMLYVLLAAFGVSTWLVAEWLIDRPLAYFLLWVLPVAIFLFGPAFVAALSLATGGRNEQ